jgi:protein-S-isoprenylcysteine O-methyltransferase Ste14
MLKLPPPIWTLIFLVVAAAISFALGWPKVPGLPLPPLGTALVVVAFIPAVWAAGLFRGEGTEINPTSPTNRVLVTRGPYRFTRNPMYLGLITFALGIAIWVGTWPMFLAPIAVFATTNFVHIPFEETKMRRQFGAAYEDYAARALLDGVTQTDARHANNAAGRHFQAVKICAGGDRVGVMPH